MASTCQGAPRPPGPHRLRGPGRRACLALPGVGAELRCTARPRHPAASAAAAPEPEAENVWKEVAAGDGAGPGRPRLTRAAPGGLCSPASTGGGGSGQTGPGRGRAWVLDCGWGPRWSQAEVPEEMSPSARPTCSRAAPRECRLCSKVAAAGQEMAGTGLPVAATQSLDTAPRPRPGPALLSGCPTVGPEPVRGPRALRRGVRAAGTGGAGQRQTPASLPGGLGPPEARARLRPAPTAPV